MQICFIYLCVRASLKSQKKNRVEYFSCHCYPHTNTATRSKKRQLVGIGDFKFYLHVSKRSKALGIYGFDANWMIIWYMMLLPIIPVTETFLFLLTKLNQLRIVNFFSIIVFPFLFKIQF